MNYIDLLEIIKKEFPNKVKEILEVLELSKLIIGDVIENVGLKIEDVFSKEHYNKIPYYTKIAKELNKYEKEVEKLIEMLNMDNSSIVDRKENKTINYDKYSVDKTIGYSLYYDFTHKRPYAFKLVDNELIKVKTWKEILLKVCNILIKIDEEKFLNFEKLKHMNGRKKQYFSKKSIDMKSPKKIDDKIYVETNLSANSIRNLLIKLLKEYKFKTTDLKIYLRADYTKLDRKLK